MFQAAKRGKSHQIRAWLLEIRENKWYLQFLSPKVSSYLREVLALEEFRASIQAHDILFDTRDFCFYGIVSKQQAHFQTDCFKQQPELLGWYREPESELLKTLSVFPSLTRSLRRYKRF